MPDASFFVSVNEFEMQLFLKIVIQMQIKTIIHMYCQKNSRVFIFSLY